EDPRTPQPDDSGAARPFARPDAERAAPEAAGGASNVSELASRGTRRDRRGRASAPTAQSDRAAASHCDRVPIDRDPGIAAEDVPVGRTGTGGTDGRVDAVDPVSHGRDRFSLEEDRA